MLRLEQSSDSTQQAIIISKYAFAYFFKISELISKLVSLKILYRSNQLFKSWENYILSFEVKSY